MNMLSSFCLDIWNKAQAHVRVRKQPIIALYFESENELKYYNLEARVRNYNASLELRKT